MSRYDSDWVNACGEDLGRLRAGNPVFAGNNKEGDSPDSELGGQSLVGSHLRQKLFRL